jgi:hypothetical protein
MELALILGLVHFIIVIYTNFGAIQLMLSLEDFPLVEIHD